MASPIISPKELAALEAAVLLDARSKTAFDAGHLRGALNVDPGVQLSAASSPGFDPATGGRHPLPSLSQWRTTLGLLGIGSGTPVVIYDDQAGANAAARAWWMLKAIGHEAAQVLDGGLKAALGAGLDLTSDPPTAEPCAHYPATAWLLPTVDLDVVEKLAKHPEWRVVDVRASERYQGITEPLDPVAGHIPGAVNLAFSNNVDAEGRFKSPAELRALYTQLLGGLRPDHLVVHCGSGITACHTLLALEHAGLPGSALYAGSWSEWCRSGKPVATGVEP
ncbi:MAG: sulfurtransferase [Holophagaceae bacterium]|nr:sulfurtransferase [Holophagaceae bacterium]